MNFFKKLTLTNRSGIFKIILILLALLLAYRAAIFISKGELFDSLRRDKTASLDKADNVVSLGDSRTIKRTNERGKWLKKLREKAQEIHESIKENKNQAAVKTKPRSSIIFTHQHIAAHPTKSVISLMKELKARKLHTKTIAQKTTSSLGLQTEIIDQSEATEDEMDQSESTFLYTGDKNTQSEISQRKAIPSNRNSFDRILRPMLSDNAMSGINIPKQENEYKTLEEMRIAMKRQRNLNGPKFAKMNDGWGLDTDGKPDYYELIMTTEKPAGNNTCYDWEYKQADYTLIYKPTMKHQNTPCSYPKSETVKKIITQEKEVIWKGCTNETKSCSETPYFDKRKNIRMNVPPCCLKHLLEMLRNIDQEFNKNNITYSVIGGALLGWYRNGEIVPYDRDLDLQVDGAIFKTKIWFDVFKTLEQKYGYIYRQAEDFKIKVQYSKYNNLDIDIWPYYNIQLRTPYGMLQPGEWISFIFHAHETCLRTSDLLPPRRATISGVPCYIPNNVLPYFRGNFGSDPNKWIPELTCKRKSGENCIS